MSPQERAQFGTIVGLDDQTIPQPEAPAPLQEPNTVSIEKKIKDITAPVKVDLKLTAEQHNRLLRLCSEHSQSPNDYITSLVCKDLESRIGRASVTGPSRLSGNTIGKTVTGPSKHVRVR